MSKSKNDKPIDQMAANLDGKVQVNGQTEASNIDMKLQAPQSGNTEIKEIEEPKSAINTKKAAEVVSAGQDSSGIGGLRRGAITFSGGAGRTQGDESATTKEDKPYKSGDRTGRRADPITRKIDYLDAEIFKNKYYQSKPLSETTKGIGYNGNYLNEHVITQKNSGGAPADPMFERSVDEIALDMLYYSAGQMNIGSGDSKRNLSIHSWDPSANSGSGAFEQNPTTFAMGNYLARKLTVKISEVNNVHTITDFTFDNADLSVPFIDEETYRLAGDAFLRDRNQREIDRNTMITLAGNESETGWTPMADAIIDATDQNRLQAQFDAMVGDHVYLSVRKLSQALSYQINKASKDGAKTVGPMAEMVNGCIPLKGYGADESVSETNGRAYCFNANAYVKGGSGLWLAINDSIDKYTTKGKLLSLPLSFKSAVATALSNMDPLVMHENLHNELKHNELFSTLDGPYDPLKPICVTDKAALITPLPIDICKSGTIFDTTTNTLKNEMYIMHYENMRNKYNVTIKNYLVGGIFRWFNERVDRLWDKTKSTAVNNVVTIEIPIVSATTSISLWDLILCSAVPYIVEERIVVLTEILKYERLHGYPYTGSIHLKDVDIHACDNFTFNGVESELQAGLAKPVSAIKVIMPEVFWPVAKRSGYALGTNKAGTIAFTILPHYFVQNQFIYDKDNDTTVPRKLVLSDEAATMAYPTTRSGNMLSFSDTIYGMDEEDYKLALDRMVTYPGYQPSYPNITKFASTSSNSTVPVQAKVYKYGLTVDGSPVIPYFAYANNSNDANYTLTVGDILSTPRELGLFQIAPGGVLTPIMNAAGTALNIVATTSSYLGLSGPGFRAKIYHGYGNSMTFNILAPGTMNINANASLKYDFKTIYATPASAATDIGILFRANVSSNSMTPFVSGAFCTAVGTYDSNTGVYTTNEALDNSISLKSNFKYLWNRLQRLPFAINPFDCNNNDITSATSTLTSINDHDIYDFLYMFGWAGFRASDYKELIYQRTKERIAKGMNYVSDPFVTKTFLLK